MVLKPVARRLLPAHVFDQLVEEVVEGDLSAGQALPSERHLAEVLGVSRPAVREAMQRLSQAGLVEVRHGGSTTVRDFRRSAGLDLLPRLLVRSGAIDPHVGRSILQARQAIAPEVAAIAARQSTPASAATLHAAVEALVVASGSAARQHAALAFWDAVIDAADSIVFRLLFNSLRSAYEPVIEALGPVMEAEVDNLDGYRALATAISAAEPAEAKQAAEELLRPATEAIGRLLALLEPAATPDATEETR